MSTYDVSVICLVYNADVNKLLTTLKSIIYQENCNFEIIVADDGSKNNYKELIEKYFRKNNFVNYKLVLNTKNCGIVKNLISGLDVASGKYVKQISPGDYLFNQYTLSKVFDFAEKNSANLLFGDAVFYTYDNNELNILPRKAPWFSEIYTNDMNYDYNKINGIATATKFGGVSWSKIFADKGIAETDKNKRLFMYGVALHTVTDLFAHSTTIKGADGTWKYITHATNADGDAIPDADDNDYYPNRFTCTKRMTSEVVKRIKRNTKGSLEDFINALVDYKGAFKIPSYANKAEAVDSIYYNANKAAFDQIVN